MRRMLFVAALFLPALNARAQDAVSLPDTTITATRIPTLIDSIPAGVTVIDRATIEARGYTTLADALAAVPGLRIVQSGGPGGNASVFIRGSDSADVLVLRDGVPINDPSDPNDAFNFGVDTLGDIDRIEIVRGPMSSLYGSGAIGGVINLITDKGEGAPHGSVSVAAGAPLAGQTIGTLSGKSGKFDYSLDAEGTDQTGFDPTPKRESVYTGTNKPFKSGMASVNLGFTPASGTRFYVLARGRSASFNLIELGFPNYDSRDYTGTDDSVFGEVGATTSLFNGVWESGVLLAQSDTDRRYNEPLEAADPNQTSYFANNHGTMTNAQWNNTVHLPDAGPASNDALTFGYQHSHSTVATWLNENSAGYPYAATTHASEDANLGHAGVQATLFKRLTLTGSILEQGATYGGSAFTWRAGGVLALPEIFSRLKASYGTAFLAPSLYDLFGLDSSGYVGNPNLKPERSHGYELGWEIDAPIGQRARAVSVEATYFNTRVSDLINFQYNPDGSSTEVNIGQARIQGVETSLAVQPASWLQAVASYTYTDSRNAATNTLLLRRPLNAASLDVTVTPLPGLTVTPEIIYSGAFVDYPVDNSGYQAFVPGPVKGGTVFNLTVNYRVLPRVSLFADGRNLGNSQYEPASGYVTPGPSVLAGVRMTF
jgi:vitamin B12 transporter